MKYGLLYTVYSKTEIASGVEKMVLKKVSLAELAYRELVRAVIDGSLAAGERLAEEQLAERFGISRTPVREALRRLNEEGLVETVPRCGFRVCRPEPAEIEALFDCRARIEPLALELAWGKIPADRLRELAWALEQAERSSDRAGALEVDEALHGTIAESCPNRPLAEIVERLIRRTAPFRNWRGFEGDCGGLFQERRELIQALAGNSAARAMELLVAHIRRGAAAVTRK